MKIKGEIYNDEIEEQNYYETYLMETGGELRRDRYYYAKHSFVDGYFDPIGIDHDGVMYWELSPDSFVEIYNEIKETNINIKIKMKIVDELAGLLKKAGKNVKVSYY